MRSGDLARQAKIYKSTQTPTSTKKMKSKDGTFVSPKTKGAGRNDEGQFKPKEGYS
jgi:hypothetical protein